MKNNPNIDIGKTIINKIETHLLRHCGNPEKTAKLVPKHSSEVLYYEESAKVGQITVPLCLINHGSSPAWDINIEISPGHGAPFNPGVISVGKISGVKLDDNLPPGKNFTNANKDFQVHTPDSEDYCQDFQNNEVSRKNKIAVAVHLKGHYKDLAQRIDKLEVNIQLRWMDYSAWENKTAPRFFRTEHKVFTIKYNERNQHNTENPHVVGRFSETHPNIYFERGAIHDLLKRTVEIDNLSKVLNLFGQRGVGKTALLSQVQKMVREKGLDEILFSFREIDDLDRGPAFFSWIEPLIRFCERLKRSNIKMNREQFLSEPLQTINEFFYTCQSLFVEYCQNRSVFMLFDDIDRAQKRFSDYRPFEQFILFLSSACENQKLSIVFAGTQNLDEMVYERGFWNDLARKADCEDVKFFNKKETYGFIELSRNQSKIDYSTFARDNIHQATAGHPYLLQLLCHRLVESTQEWKYLRPLDFWDVDESIEKLANSKMNGENVGHLKYIWDGFNDAEKWALYLLADGLLGAEGATSTKGVSILDIGKAMLKKYSREVNFGEVISHLAADNIIVENQGLLYFQVNLLEKWIYNKIEILKDALPSRILPDQSTSIGAKQKSAV